MKLKHSILVYINLFFHLFLFWHKLDVPNTRAHIHIESGSLFTGLAKRGAGQSG